MKSPKEQKDIVSYSNDFPFKFLYVSIVTVYKHQWNVIEAILKLREEGFPVELQLVGPSTPESMLKVKLAINNDEDKIIKYLGAIPYEELSEIYKKADGFIFASSCENQPIILLEAMSSGLPIACSNMGPMPEVLQNSGFYFNPLDVNSIYSSIKEYLLNKDQRMKISQNSKEYTWKDCAEKTFDFLSKFELCKK